MPLPATAQTDAPGAPISGLIVLAMVDGPRDDEPTMLPTSGMLTASETLTLTVAPPASCALMAVAEGLLDDHGRDEGVAPTEREADRVAGGDEADQDGGRTGLRGTIDLEADGARAAIDERDLAGRAREVRIVRVGAVDRLGRAAPSDVGDVAGEAAPEGRPIDGLGVRVGPGDRRRAC